MTASRLPRCPPLLVSLPLSTGPLGTSSTWSVVSPATAATACRRHRVGSASPWPGCSPTHSQVAAGVPPAQAGRVIVLVSSVTAPLRARTRPSTVAAVVRVMEVSARIEPRNAEPVPSVAELPTCQ